WSDSPCSTLYLRTNPKDGSAFGQGLAYHSCVHDPPPGRTKRGTGLIAEADQEIARQLLALRHVARDGLGCAGGAAAIAGIAAIAAVETGDRARAAFALRLLRLDRALHLVPPLARFL